MSAMQSQPEPAPTEHAWSMLYLFGGPAIAFLAALFYV